MSLTEAVKFAFQEGETRKRIAILFIITLVLMTFSGFFSALTEAPLRLLNEFTQSGDLPTTFQPLINTGLLVTGMLGFVLSLLLIPVSLYLYGYTFIFTKGVMHSQNDPLPEHDNFTEKIKMGLYKFLLELPVSFITAFIVFIPAIAFAVLLLASSGFSTPQTPENIPLLILLGILVFVFIFFVIIFSILVQNAIYFNYLNGTGGFGALNPRRILNVIRIGWKSIFKATFLTIFLAIVTFVLNIFLICFVFISYPLSVALFQVISSHIFGQAYKQIKKDLG